MFCLMDAGSSRVFHEDGRLYGPMNPNPRDGRNKMNAKRRIAALERKVCELGGEPPTKRPEDVELPFAVQDLWAEEEPTAENTDEDLGFEVRDLWAD